MKKINIHLDFFGGELGTIQFLNVILKERSKKFNVINFPQNDGKRLYTKFKYIGL